VTQITAFGNVQDNGVDTSVGAYFTGPCGATFFENSGTGASCGLTGVSSGTLTATINVIADVTPRGQQPSFGIASIAQFQFGLDPVSIPEPALWPVVLIGLLLGVPRLRYCRASSRRRSSAAIVSR
jgi:hypothetical protein